MPPIPRMCPLHLHPPMDEVIDKLLSHWTLFASLSSPPSLQDLYATTSRPVAVLVKMASSPSPTPHLHFMQTFAGASLRIIGWGYGVSRWASTGGTRYQLAVVFCIRITVKLFPLALIRNGYHTIATTCEFPLFYSIFVGVTIPSAWERTR